MLSDCSPFYIPIFLIIIGNVKNDCFDLINGEAVYTGTTSITKTGRICQRWDSLVPHDHPYCCDKVTSADKNYCRNPDQYHITWCMTSDPGKVWEECAVPNCVDTTTVSSTTEPSTAITTTLVSISQKSIMASTTNKPSTFSTTTETTTATFTTESSIATTTTESTYQQDAITSTGSFCQCPCTDRKQFWFAFYYGDLTDEEKQQILHQEQQRLRKELLVDTNYLSSYRRQKISADDQRTSAESIGTVGAAILVVIFTLFIINDLISLCIHIYSSGKKNKIHACV